MEENTQTELFFDNIRGKHLSADFEGGAVTSDGGALFLRASEKRCGVIRRFYSTLLDHRHPSYVDHSLQELVTQRVVQIACGYEDGNDSDDLRTDPGIKSACGILPFGDDALASQPTMSRFENGVSRSDLYRIGLGFMKTFVASYARAPRRIILDIDDTDDVVHGGQQLSLFNAHVGDYCYQPMHLYEGISGKFITALLRPGKCPSGIEIRMVLKHVIKHLRACWPRTIIILRGDSHYSTPEVHDFCEDNGLFYVLGQNINPSIKRLAPQEFIGDLYTALEKKVILFDEARYQAKTWRSERRIIIKTVASEKGIDVRGIITNLSWKDGRRLYERLYCDRGRMENFIKNHKSVLRSDKTSCHRFEANQLRLFLHSAAYVLLQTLQEVGLKGTEYARAQFDTIQKRIIKIGARVVEKTRRIFFHFPTSYPGKDILCHLNKNLCVDTA